MTFKVSAALQQTTRAFVLPNIAARVANSRKSCPAKRILYTAHP
jgi:hypothetical protein